MDYYPNGAGSSPCAWRPNRQPKYIPGGEVKAGDWVVVEISYRDTNTTPVEYVPGYFLIHVVFQPNCDELDQTGSQNGQARTQPVMYGGGADKMASQFHFDPGVAFQAPWDGQLSVVAGGDSAVDTCMVDVILKRGRTPQQPVQQVAVNEYGEVVGPLPMRNERVYAPPSVGLPQQLLPSTYVEVPINARIPFTSGAVEMQVTGDVAVSPAPIEIVMRSMGRGSGVRAPLRKFMTSGQPECISAYAQGGAGKAGRPATWSPASHLSSAVIYSKVGC